MNNFSQAYLNGFAILVLILIIRNSRRKFKNLAIDEKLFILLIFNVMAVLTTSAILECFWGVRGKTAHTLLYISQTSDFILSIMITMLWLYYCIYRIYPNIKIKSIYKYLIPAPALLFIIFMIASAKFGLVFKISQLNEYTRGPFFIGGMAIGYAYLIAALVVIIIKRKSLNMSELFLYLLFPLLPSALSILERLDFLPMYFTWASASLVLLEIHLHVLNKRSNIDYLTNLNNRMAFDDYIKETINLSLSLDQPFGLIVLDIDDFKAVNDKYGHTEGDRALKAASKILCDSFTGKNFLSRYGGDEFAIVIRDCEHDLLDYYLAKLKKQCKSYNKSSNKPYQIEFSIGAYVFKEDEITDPHSMFMLVDKIMYNNKFANK